MTVARAQFPFVMRESALGAIGGQELEDLDDEERSALLAALAEGIAEDDAGDTVDADEVFAYMRSRAS